MVALAAVWFFSWYIAWFNHSDCLEALRQIGGSDPALYRSTQNDCGSAARWRLSIERYWLALVLLGELMLLLRVGRGS